ncbi:hypothetical protein ABID22_003770 [Pontibacter aydingkolensis]|uniref:Nucleotide-diphospho-sugar transferase n=1 Tax=Pontibacter aydingkolensis TaxID=1911536 RepID=A0ABS7CYZ0_9BACT|nr:nucleotide-diphospho-sugar transferase [Pontibacter aydingkolensis]MBW7469037.1 nucleotide-diphospho-sugar transferase [Pontibacter aydingkolensis]
MNNNYNSPLSSALNTPVLFIVFNRLGTTKEVFSAIREAKPTRLYVAADGPRESRPGEDKKVQAVREFILENVDWKCEVKTLFRDQNLGCGNAVSGAISWLFEHEEMGIILEDDCLPSQSFFTFAEEALIKFKDHENIYGITGDYRGPVNPEIAHNISLISFPLIWGWATWRRVWQNYDKSMAGWTGTINDLPKLKNASRDTKRYFQRSFSKTAAGEINTWDYQLSFQILKNNGSFISPNLNMISNIGYGEDSTHLVNFDPANNGLPIHEVKVDLSKFVDNGYDAWLCRNAFNRKSVPVRVINKLKRVVSGKK